MLVLITCIQMCIDASKVVSACILFWSTWLPFSEHRRLSSGHTHHHSSPTKHVHGGVHVQNSESTGTNLCSSLVITALHVYCYKIHTLLLPVIIKQWKKIILTPTHWVLGLRKWKKEILYFFHLFS